MNAALNTVLSSGCSDALSRPVFAGVNLKDTRILGFRNEDIYAPPQPKPQAQELKTRYNTVFKFWVEARNFCSRHLAFKSAETLLSFSSKDLIPARK